MLNAPKSCTKTSHWYRFCEIKTTVLLLLQLIRSNPEKVLENIPNRAAGTDRPDHISLVGHSNLPGPKLGGKTGGQ